MVVSSSGPLLEAYVAGSLTRYGVQNGNKALAMYNPSVGPLARGTVA